MPFNGQTGYYVAYSRLDSVGVTSGGAGYIKTTVYLQEINGNGSVVNRKVSNTFYGDASKTPIHYGCFVTFDVDGKLLVSPANPIFTSGAPLFSLKSTNAYTIRFDVEADVFPFVELLLPSDMGLNPLPDFNEAEVPLVVEVPSLDYLAQMFPNLTFDELLQKAIEMILANPNFVVAPESLPGSGALPESWFDPAGNPIGETLPNVDPAIPTVPTVPDDTLINWEPLRVLGDTFTKKFPFSLPWDLLRGLESLESTAWDRKIVISISGQDYWPAMTIDLSMFDEIAGITRIVLLIVFDFGLIFTTRRLMGGDV